MTWRPIETAPKDGTEVVLWLNEFDGAVIGRFDWNSYTYSYTWLDKCGVDEYAIDFNPEITPTHWTPIPPDPNQ